MAPSNDGTGQQPAQPDYKCACLEFWDSHHPECPTGFGRPAQPDYDPIAAVGAVEHYEASAKALDALDARPGSGEAAGRLRALQRAYGCIPGIGATLNRDVAEVLAELAAAQQRIAALESENSRKAT